MLWALIRTLGICLLATFGFFVLLLLDYEWEAALFVGATLAVIITLLYFFFYRRGHLLPVPEMIVTVVMLLGYWLIFYALTQCQRNSTTVTHLVLGIGLLALIAPFLVLGIFSHRWQYAVSGRVWRGVGAMNQHHNKPTGGGRARGGNVQDSYLQNHYASRELDPNEFSELQDPYFPSQAYEWFWVNPLMIALGLVEGFILALLLALSFGLNYAVLGFAGGILIVAFIFGWVVYNK